MIKLIGLAVIGLCMGSTAVGELGGPVWLQYGALGLAGMMVVFLCYFLKTLLEQQNKERIILLDKLEAVRETADNRLSELVRRNSETFNRLARLLESRPCLHENKDIRGE